MSQGKKLFIRESSGLVRQMGAKHAFAKVLALIVPISLYYTLIYSPAIPAANWYIGITIAPIIALPIFLVYLKLAEYIPRSSGEYIYISRIIGPLPATIQGMANIISTPLLAAILSQIEVSAGIGPAFQIIGLAFKNSALFNLGTEILSNPDYFFLASLVSLVLMWIVSISPQKIMANFLFAIATMQVVGAILIIGLFAQGRTAFVNDFNKFSSTFSGPNYQDLYSQGLSYYSPYTDPLQTFVFAILMLMWLFVWFFGPSYFAGEYKQATRSLKVGMLIGYGIATALIIGLTVYTATTMGIPFFNEVALNGWGSSNPVSASEGYIAWAGVMVVSSPILALLVGVLNIGIQFVAGPLSLAIPARVMLAMAFDRILPEKLAYVNPTTQSPLIASGVALALGVFFEYATQFLGFAVSTIALIAVLFIYQFLQATISATVAGIKGIPSVELSQKEKKELLITGIISSAVLVIAVITAIGYALINSLYNSMVLAGNLPLNLTLIAIIPIIGVITYYISKYYRQKEGVDLKLVFTEIPPE
ncbi:APC family permease [Stygiolobus caldivivus]|uniref:Amino acid permease n=1 Tax=Stygiolobus caldivivus TaxID=2824673 RepID=A0A8D5U992_9CREN|nr:APC family permease [Stygiolobus caldivivus]BCU71592.1 amino acid permease [Stygiolobus caldivivus]